MNTNSLIIGNDETSLNQPVSTCQKISPVWLFMAINMTNRLTMFNNGVNCCYFYSSTTKSRNDSLEEQSHIQRRRFDNFDYGITADCLMSLFWFQMTCENNFYLKDTEEKK